VAEGAGVGARAGAWRVRALGVLYHPRMPSARALAQEVRAWAEARGCTAPIAPNDADGPAALAGWLEGLDLLVTLGGDGSILRAVRAAAPCGTPLLGVNLGRVGFLTETDPDGWQAVLERVLAGEGWIEERMMLREVARRGPERLSEADALNDVVVGRGARARVVQLVTRVDGGELATYVADGLIVATATGSTAYALAAGGPVLPPQLRNILLVPVAPHLSMERPVVLAQGVSVQITVVGERPAVLTVDGEVRAELEGGDEVTVGASPHVARFLRVQDPAYFYRTLLARLVPRS